MASLIGPLKWHGGKQYLASRFATYIPPHLSYVEPYAGGLALLLARSGEDVSETVNDCDRQLMNFWHVLREESLFEKFRRMVDATPFSESQWMESKAAAANGVEDQVSAAYHFFVRCRQSLAGRMASFAPLSRTRIRRGMNEQVSAWLTAVEGLPAVHARLRRVAILCRPAIDVITSLDGPQTFFYLDPPYLHETRAVKDVYGVNEMDCDAHINLLSVLAALQGKFMLSGYRSKLYDQYAAQHGWHHVEFDLPNNAAGGRHKRRMTECIWMNYSCAAENTT